MTWYPTPPDPEEPPLFADGIVEVAGVEAAEAISTLLPIATLPAES